MKFRVPRMIHCTTLCCALLLFLIAGTAYAEPVTQSIRLKVLPDKVEEFEALVAQLVRDVYANEPGVQFYEVRRVQDQPLTYVYFLSFEDQAAFDRYSAADWHRQMSPKAVACLDGSPVFENLESFY